MAEEPNKDIQLLKEREIKGNKYFLLVLTSLSSVGGFAYSAMNKNRKVVSNYIYIYIYIGWGCGRPHITCTHGIFSIYIVHPHMEK